MQACFDEKGLGGGGEKSWCAKNLPWFACTTDIHTDMTEQLCICIDYDGYRLALVAF